MLKKGTLFILTIFLITAGTLQALSPTIIVGGFVETDLYEFEGTSTSSPVDIGASGNIGYRFPIADGGYAAIDGGFLLSGLRSAFDNGWMPYDSEYIDSRIVLPAGDDRIEIRGSLLSSLLGEAKEGLFITPEWEMRYRFERGRRKVRPYLAYTGEYHNPEIDSGERFSTGGKAGFKFSPRIETVYDVHVSGMWEIYPDLTGDTGGRREDLLAALETSVDLIPKPFWDISLSPSLSLRISNLTSKETMVLNLPAKVHWSPHRSWSVQLDGSMAPTLYRAADQIDIEYRTTIRIDRTVGESFFLFLQGGGGKIVSEEVLRESSDIFIRAGIDISF